MKFDGVDGDRELSRDFLVGCAFGERRQNVEFSRRKGEGGFRPVSTRNEHGVGGLAWGGEPKPRHVRKKRGEPIGERRLADLDRNDDRGWRLVGHFAGGLSAIVNVSWSG